MAELKTYALIDSNNVVFNLTHWDGESEYAPTDCEGKPLTKVLVTLENAAALQMGETYKT